DPGKVEGNMVFTYLDVFAKDKAYVEELKKQYQNGGLGDVKIKRYLIDVLDEELTPMRKRREAFAQDPQYVMELLKEGSLSAEKVAAQTLDEVKTAMGINYFR
ncbi:MAG: tryptophan--tRNA ligase, partial [Tetragenococcus halophilus]|nr:tryptophan--tRNA ligase [Tetragenococcus halophilus]